MRTSVKQLESLATYVSCLVGQQWSIEKAAFQGYRVCRNNGSHNVSPVLSKTQLHDWLHAFKEGVFAERGRAK